MKYPHSSFKRIKERLGKNRDYLQWLREQTCYLADHGGCSGDIVPAHTPDKSTKGAGMKVDDRFAMPLCFEHHRDQHQRGWVTFSEMYEFDPRLVSAQYFRKSPYG